MLFLLDTSVLSALMREDNEIATWLATVAPVDRVITCTPARGEILFGLARLPAGRRRNELESKAASVFAALPCEPIPAAAADSHAVLKNEQQTRGLTLDENDLWIAATAVTLGATLVTRDKDFHRIRSVAVLTP